MDKQVYVPSEEELYQMQDMGANVYKYLLVKAIETLAMDGIKYKNKGMFKNAYKYLRDNPEIAYAICKMYPEEMIYSETAREDIDLAIDITLKSDDRKIYRLDNLVYFENDVLNNCNVGEQAIYILKNKLPFTPQYRFEYKDFVFLGYDKSNHPILKYNKLLNDIFGCKYGNPKFEKKDVIEDLITIEPAYALRYEEQLKTDAVGLLRSGVNDYARRYGISNDVGYEYNKKDILTNPNEDVKRLVKCINNGEKKIRLW